MRLLSLICLSLCLSLACFSQSKLDDFACRLKKMKVKNDLDLLKKAFHYSHKEFLKQYRAYAQPEDIERTGNFDCLSGTEFFSQLLSRLNISYRIYETNYHIFLIAETSKGKALIETTDKYRGLVTNRFEMEARIDSYLDSKDASPSSYLSGVFIFNEVNPSQLAGLCYFNKAVLNFLQKDFEKSCSFLRQSHEIYDTPRISEFSKVLILQISGSDLSSSRKEELIAQIKPFVADLSSFASR